MPELNSFYEIAWKRSEDLGLGLNRSDFRNSVSFVLSGIMEIDRPESPDALRFALMCFTEGAQDERATFNLIYAKYIMPIYGSSTYAAHEYLMNPITWNYKVYCRVIADTFLRDDLYKDLFEVFYKNAWKDQKA